MPRLAIYTGWVYTPVGCIHRNRCIHPTGVYGQSRHHANLPDTFSSKKVWVWSIVGHAAQQRGRPVRGIPPWVYTPEPVYTPNRCIWPVEAPSQPSRHNRHILFQKSFGCGAMLGMLLNSVDGRFGVYPLGCIHRNRCIHPTGVYGQSRHHANLPDTFFSKKVLGVEQCWACCSIAWTAGSEYTPVGGILRTGRPRY